MSDTPNTDSNAWTETNAANAVVLASFARNLERDLNLITRERDELLVALEASKQECDKLEHEVDSLLKCLDF